SAPAPPVALDASARASPALGWDGLGRRTEVVLADGGNAEPGAGEAPDAHTVGLDTLAEGERVSSLAVGKVERGYTLASITYVNQFPSGASKAGRAAPPAANAPRAATVVVRALEERGDLKKSPTVISVKAESVGGIALAPSPFAAGEAAL